MEALKNKNAVDIGEEANKNKEKIQVITTPDEFGDDHQLAALAAAAKAAPRNTTVAKIEPKTAVSTSATTAQNGFNAKPLNTNTPEPIQEVSNSTHQSVESSPWAHMQLHEFAPKIVVVGVGGAGTNAVNNMVASGLSGELLRLSSATYSLERLFAIQSCIYPNSANPCHLINNCRS